MQTTISGEITPLQVAEGAVSNLIQGSGLSLEEVAAASIRLLSRTPTPTARLVQYCVDVAGDQFMSEEYYQRFPGLLSFLAKCGCGNEEVQFHDWIQQHPDVFHCKAYQCDGTIVGGCPKMFCDQCGKQYFLQLDGITDTVCDRCVARDLGECSEESRRRRYQIYGIV